MTRRTAIASATAASMTPSIISSAKTASDTLTGEFTLRPARERGMADFGWLKSAHSFSFGQYFHPDHMGFGPLRVINDDQVAPGNGFPMHPHENFEIFSYVLSGELEHKDSMGNGSVVSAGGIQYMSAGTGVRHSEFNPSNEARSEFLQIWVQPNVQNQAPRYETQDLSPADKDGKLALFLSGDGRDGSMHIKADTDIYAATLKAGQTFQTELPKGRLGWVQVARGQLSVNGQLLDTGDGLAIRKGGTLVFDKGVDAEFLYFDMAL